MEKHHKLRRPQGSSLHGCNICGKEGHQAAHCAVGTVDWATKWVKEAFVADKPHTFIEPDYKGIAMKAKAWAEDKKKRKAAQALQAENGDENGGEADGVKKEGGEGALPGGWQTFFDQFRRPYYFHAATNTTQWTAPAGVTPAIPPPMPPPIPGPTPPAAAPAAVAEGAEAAAEPAAEPAADGVPAAEELAPAEEDSAPAAPEDAAVEEAAAAE